MLITNKFLPTIDGPTRKTSITATLIDNFFKNFPLEETKSAIICQNISDHLPILVTIEMIISKNNMNIENKVYSKINDNRENFLNNLHFVNNG